MNHKEMHDIYAPWEYLLREKLEDADRIASRVDSEAAMFGIPASVRRQYIADKVLKLIDEIAEERESHYRRKKDDDMRKKHWAAGGQIKERKSTRKGRQKGEQYKMYVKTKVEPGPDLIIQSLEVPLTTEQSNRIVELAEYGWLRSDIAKEVGIPKTRVNHELVKRKGGGAA
ncbi:hypothetical protein ABIE27_000366 [Paenibacillus sp. 4624]|uniref:hypothetical protein n=1 Tax=Paenibacillus sp. 4624 TaxID=3156453 RepID=UPI003D1BFB63